MSYITKRWLEYQNEKTSGYWYMYQLSFLCPLTGKKKKEESVESFLASIQICRCINQVIKDKWAMWHILQKKHTYKIIPSMAILSTTSQNVHCPFWSMDSMDNSLQTSGQGKTVLVSKHGVKTKLNIESRKQPINTFQMAYLPFSMIPIWLTCLQACTHTSCTCSFPPPPIPQHTPI